MRRLCIAALLVAGSLPAAAQSNSEEFARRQYESGLSFLQNRRYAEALKDFQAVVDSFPKSSVADNALLQIAEYQLDVARDVGASQTAIDRLLKEYPDTDSTPMAYVVAGRLALAKGHAPADVDAALASFERVPRLFPGDMAVPAAGFYAGEALRAVRRTDEALERYRRVGMEYPRSIWAARAGLAAASCLVQTERAPRALEELQRIRQRFPGTAEATDALNLNTILYRLYVRVPTQPPYVFGGRYVGGENARFKDVVGVSIDADGRVLLGHRNGIAVFDGKGAMTRSVGADGPSAFFLDERGRIVIVRRDVMAVEAGESAAVAIPSPDGKPRQVEDIPAAVALPNGDRLVADHKGKGVLRVSNAGKYLGAFATISADRLALNYLNDVAVLDHDSKSVTVFDRDGKTVGRIVTKGAGYELDNPVDIAFDPLGHLYVLDRGRAAVFVFGTKNRLIASLTAPDRTTGSLQKPQAFALDAAGRLFVYDDRSQRIQVYQ